MTEAEIEQSRFDWRAAARVLREAAGEDMDQESWSAGLAQGYASALEMVLRG